MTRRSVIHVVPGRAGGWKVETSQGATRYNSKEKAIDEAKRRAKRATLGQVVIHGRNGRIQTEHTYGSDPMRHRG